MVTVLTIDDDEAILLLVQTILKRTSYRSLFASSGSEGLYMAEAEQPDIILLDDSLPVMSGKEVAAQLRTNPRTDSIPVIIFSAALDSRRPDYAQSQGGDALLAKPFSKNDLLNILDSYLGK